MIYEQLSMKLNYINNELNSIQQELSLLPQDKLLVVKDRASWKWHVKNTSGTTYLPKKQRKYAQELAQVQYLNARKLDLENEKLYISTYLDLHAANCGNVKKLLNNNGMRTLLAANYIPNSPDIAQWMNEPFEQNPKYPNQLLHDSFSGHLLRSKSEALIDTALYLHKIPFRYECALKINEITFYPDFTIIHPKTGKIFYWEHFGMMDVPSYAKHTFSKLQIYNENDITPSVNLITTYETRANPLSTFMVENILNYYFCS